MTHQDEESIAAESVQNEEENGQPALTISLDKKRIEISTKNPFILRPNITKAKKFKATALPSTKRKSTGVLTKASPLKNIDKPSSQKSSLTIALVKENETSKVAEGTKCPLGLQAANSVGLIKSFSELSIKDYNSPSTLSEPAQVRWVKVYNKNRKNDSLKRKPSFVVLENEDERKKVEQSNRKHKLNDETAAAPMEEAILAYYMTEPESSNSEKATTTACQTDEFLLESALYEHYLKNRIVTKIENKVQASHSFDDMTTKEQKEFLKAHLQPNLSLMRRLAEFKARKMNLNDLKHIIPPEFIAAKQQSSQMSGASRRKPSISNQSSICNEQRTKKNVSKSKSAESILVNRTSVHSASQISIRDNRLLEEAVKNWIDLKQPEAITVQNLTAPFKCGKHFAKSLTCAQQASGIKNEIANGESDNSEASVSTNSKEGQNRNSETKTTQSSSQTEKHTDSEPTAVQSRITALGSYYIPYDQRCVVEQRSKTDAKIPPTPTKKPGHSTSFPDNTMPADELEHKLSADEVEQKLSEQHVTLGASESTKSTTLHQLPPPMSYPSRISALGEYYVPYDQRGGGGGCGGGQQPQQQQKRNAELLAEAAQSQQVRRQLQSQAQAQMSSFSKNDYEPIDRRAHQSYQEQHYTLNNYVDLHNLPKQHCPSPQLSYADPQHYTQTQRNSHLQSPQQQSYPYFHQVTPQASSCNSLPCQYQNSIYYSSLGYRPSTSSAPPNLQYSQPKPSSSNQVPYTSSFVCMPCSAAQQYSFEPQQSCHDMPKKFQFFDNNQTIPVPPPTPSSTSEDFTSAFSHNGYYINRLSSGSHTNQTSPVSVRAGLYAGNRIARSSGMYYMPHARFFAVPTAATMVVTHQEEFGNVNLQSKPANMENFQAQPCSTTNRRVQSSAKRKLPERESATITSASSPLTTAPEVDSDDLMADGIQLGDEPGNKASQQTIVQLDACNTNNNVSDSSLIPGIGQRPFKAGEMTSIFTFKQKVFHMPPLYSMRFGKRCLILRTTPTPFPFPAKRFSRCATSFTDWSNLQ